MRSHQAQNGYFRIGFGEASIEDYVASIRASINVPSTYTVTFYEAVTSESQARHWNFLADSWIVTHGIRNLADIHFSRTVAYKAVRLGLKRS